MSISKTNIPKILFIKGVFKRDCINDDIFDKKILENSTYEENITDVNKHTNECEYTHYEKLPHIFESFETWKKKTNLLCWNCALKFDTVPVFVPKAIEPISLKNKQERELCLEQKFSISVHGVFCSFICARQYIESKNYSIVERTETLNKLKLLHKFFYKTKMKEYPQYPTPHQMKQFGGDLSIEEFKTQIDLFEDYDEKVLIC